MEEPFRISIELDLDQWNKVVSALYYYYDKDGSVPGFGELASSIADEVAYSMGG